MTEFRVHKVRFYEHKPEAIHCLKYNDKTNKIAVSRADNSIEIWDISEHPYQEKIIPPTADRSVESLAWCQNRLFSTGFHGDVTEYDLLRLKPKYSSLAAPNSCWCMSENSSQSHLAVGTEEGYICLFEVGAEKAEFERSFDKQEGKILCLAWHESSELIVSGSIDVLRIWNVKSGRSIHRIMVGRSDPKRQTFVWCVAFTRDFQIVSGDSRGSVSFWDAKQGSEIDSFRSHKSDVLTLCLNKEGDRVCASGVDPCIISFERLLSQEGGIKERRRWVKTLVRAPHTHDVRTLTFAGQYLASGGVDTYLSLMKYPSATHWSYPSLPQSPTVHVATKANVILLRYPHYLEMWRLGAATKLSGAEGEKLPLSSDPIKLVCLKALEKEVIVCCAISSSCRWLAYGTASHLRIFRILITENLDSPHPQITLQKVGSIPNSCLPCHRMMISPDEEKLVTATEDGRLQVLKLNNDGAVLLHTLAPSSGHSDCIHLLDISSNSRLVACADHFSNVTVFDLNNGQVHCTLPRLEIQPTALAFHPGSSNLVVVYSNQKIVEYDVVRKRLTDWSRQSQQTLSRWTCHKYPTLNVTFDPRNDDVIILHDDSRITVIDKREMMTEEKVRDTESGRSPKKTRMNSRSPNQDRQLPRGLHVVSDKYKHLLFFSILEDAMAIAVEVNERALFESLPPALKKKKFGT